jgi:ACS family tartrate transporter-like MFS transporter
MILYLTYWFPASHRARAVALFMTAAVASSVVGAPLSGLLLQLDGTLGLRGWKWLFLVEGLPSLVLGVAVLRVLPEGPRQARWLRPQELRWLEARLEAERAEAPHDRASLARALADPRVLLLALAYFTSALGGYGLDFFVPTLMRRAFPAASPWQLGLLCAVAPAVAMVAMILHGRSSDRRAERRRHFAAALWWSAAGLILASFRLPPLATLGAIVMAVSGRWSASAPFWGLATASLGGRSQAAVIAFINSVGNLGGFAGPSLMGGLEGATGDHAAGLRLLAAALLAGSTLALIAGSRLSRDTLQAAAPR